jgi:hypothetical protein
MVRERGGGNWWRMTPRQKWRMGRASPIARDPSSSSAVRCASARPQSAPFSRAAEDRRILMRRGASTPIRLKILVWTVLWDLTLRASLAPLKGVFRPPKRILRAENGRAVQTRQTQQRFLRATFGASGLRGCFSARKQNHSKGF